MHFMLNNDFEGKKILCFQKLHFKILELQNCIWGARIQDPASFPALIGGTMGLFTGFSILSAVEILYFIVKYFVLLKNK